MSIEEKLSELRGLARHGEITSWIRIEGSEGDFVEIPGHLPGQLARALKQKGIHRLFSHQVEACETARRGEHMVVVTPTASGKTLCYNLPVLESLLKDPDRRALYLFPTKALAQDQLAELRDLESLLEQPIGIETYDGDTPADTRRKIRRQARILLTNPDMLHSGILPHHPKWMELFQNLKYVIVDEIHTYRGVFGSHVANVFRRLKRIARFYNSDIQFLCSSATIANPEELASALIEAPVRRISRNGAPRSPKEVIFYNPPLVNIELGLRQGALPAARTIAQRFLEARIQTLIFVSSRVNVEVLLSYLRKAFRTHPGLPEKIRGYRGGYLPETRREIERQLRNREILGVVSTNALELGIDIGSLEACILVGYPGSIASTWQQIGRAGRRSGHSVAILVARNLPLDQYIVNCPRYFFDRSPEHARIQPDNLQILASHLKCAAFELPFEDGEKFGSEALREILDFFTEQGTLTRAGRQWHWSAESYPADTVSLRNIAEENFVVIDLAEDRAVAEVDFESAARLIHEDAIYMCEGRQYHVERLDYSGRRAYVRPVEVDYYTDAISFSNLKVLLSDRQKLSGLARIEHGEIHLARKYPGFKKVRFYTHENLGYGKIELPLQELHTTAYWFSLSEESLWERGMERSRIVRGLLGVAYALQHVASLLLMCDVHDLGRSVGDRTQCWFALPGTDGPGLYSSLSDAAPVDPERLDQFQPAVFLYDSFPGGMGFAEKLFDEHDLLLDQALEMIRGCSCRSGCPSCVGPAGEVGEEIREVSMQLLEAIRAKQPVRIQ